MSDFYREVYGSRSEPPEPAGGGPAFPCNEHAAVKVGMTLRDYFAAKAMQGLLASARDFTADEDASKPITSWDDYARGAYQMADAMLKARNE